MASERRKRTKQHKSTGQRATALTWDRAFLTSLRKLGNVTLACEAAKIDRSTPYQRRAKDELFAAQWDDAIEESIDRLEAEARRRAERGTTKPVFYQGDIVGAIQEYSDTLMTVLLKAHRPDKFGDKLTIRLDPKQIATLDKFGLTPGEAMERLIQELERQNADA